MWCYVIYDFMRNDLGLKGITLDVFAVIFSYSKAGKNMFESEGNLAIRLHCTRRCIGMALASLLTQGLVTRTETSAARTFRYEVSEKVRVKYLPTCMGNNDSRIRENSSHYRKQEIYKSDNCVYGRSRTDKRSLIEVPECFEGTDTL